MTTNELWIFILGLVFGGIVSWITSDIFFVRASVSQKEEFSRLLSELETKNTLEYFEKLLDESEWVKRFIDDRETWVCAKNNLLQIAEDDSREKFTEEWTDKFPDKRSFISKVYLSINNIRVKELNFITVDGGRIFVPIPELQNVDLKNSSRTFVWKTQSLGVRVSRKIGSYYIHNNLEGVAKMAGIKVL